MTKFLSTLLLSLILGNFFLFAQEAEPPKKWTKGGVAALNISQAAFSNWAKGGESSYSGTLLYNVFANRQGKDFTWENKFDLGYGLMYTNENGTRKTEDKLDLFSKIGYNWKKNLNITALMNLKSQIAPGYEFPNDSTVVSRFFAPAELVISLGFDWKPNSWLSLYLSPATGRYIIVMDQELADKGAYGVDPATYDGEGNKLTDGKNIDPQFGWYATFDMKRAIMTNVDLTSKLNLFQNYTDKNADNRMNIDVNWETSINMRVNDLISANIFVHVIYDHDVKLPIYDTINGIEELVGTGPRTQFKEILGIGFSYKF